MTDRLSNLLKRAKTVLEWCVKRATDVAVIAGFAAEETKLRTQVTNTEKYVQTQIKTTKGTTKFKNRKKKEMCQTVVRIAHKGAAMARSLGNEVLLGLLDSETSSILKLRDNICYNTCKVIYETIVANQGILTNITAQDITDMDNAMKDFDDIMMSVKLAIAEKKGQGTKLIPIETEKTKVTIETMYDYIFGEFFGIRMDLLFEFVAVKSIGDIGIRHSGWIFCAMEKDAATGEIIGSADKATIIIEGTAKSYKTDRNGFAVIPKMLVGKYNITVKKTGYITKNLTLMANRGKMAHVEVEMMKG